MLSSLSSPMQWQEMRTAGQILLCLASKSFLHPNRQEGGDCCIAVGPPNHWQADTVPYIGQAGRLHFEYKLAIWQARQLASSRSLCNSCQNKSGFTCSPQSLQLPLTSCIQIAQRKWQKQALLVVQLGKELAGRGQEIGNYILPERAMRIGQAPCLGSFVREQVWWRMFMSA